MFHVGFWCSMSGASKYFIQEYALMSKLKKLFKTPGLFFKDSRYFKKTYRLENKKRLGHELQESATINCLIMNDESYLDKMYQYVSNRVNLFVSHDPDALPSICVLSEVYQDAVFALADFANNVNGTMFLHEGNKKVSIEKIKNLKKKLLETKVEIIEIYCNNGYFNKFRLERWKNTKGLLEAPRNNRVARKIFTSKEIWNKLYPDNGFTYLRDLFQNPLEDDFDFEVDVVYTWVNSLDLEWQNLYQSHANSDLVSSNLSRFTNRDELKFSIRSVLQNAPWVRKIFVLTNCKPPEWVNLDSNKIFWVHHEELFDVNDLPTFNSHAIESVLHNINGLSNFFLYCNDDVFFAKPTKKSDFFLPNGLAKLRFEPYGVVNGRINESDPSYVNAARNGQRLLEQQFSKVPVQLHKHTVQCMRRDVLSEMEILFSKDLCATRRNKFRDITDVSPASFLYPHFAYMSGFGTKVDDNVLMIKETADFQKVFNNLLVLKGNNKFSELPLTICINDGVDSHENTIWNESVIGFLNIYFPDTSMVEYQYRT